MGKAKAVNHLTEGYIALRDAIKACVADNGGVIKLSTERSAALYDGAEFKKGKLQDVEYELPIELVERGADEFIAAALERIVVKHIAPWRRKDNPLATFISHLKDGVAEVYECDGKRQESAKLSEKEVKTKAVVAIAALVKDVREGRMTKEDFVKCMVAEGYDEVTANAIVG